MAEALPVFIGLDASTTACKAVAWDAQGCQLAEGRAALEMITPGPDQYEQDALHWWQATCQALHAAIASLAPARLAGLSIAHQRETFVLTDANGSPLHNAILWLDERSRPYLPGLAQQLDLAAFHQRTGKPLSGNLAIGKLAWVHEHQPEVWAAARHLLDTHAFLAQRLTGQWRTSTASADPLGLYDMQHAAWDTPSLACVGVAPEWLPQALPPSALLGRVTATAAAECGLPVGLPIYAGLGDGQAAALGCGVHQAGLASLSLGTSVISGTFSPTYLTHPAFRSMTTGLPGACILETVLLGGGYTLHWYLHQFLGERFDQSELERGAAALPPGAQGLLLLPYWNTAMGPYWDARASGVVVGWRGVHRAEHLYRAILEGIAFELRLQLSQVEAALGSPLRQVVASGGGTRSALWMQILADCLGLPVERSTAREAASLGAAMLAAAGAGAYPNVASAVEAMRPPGGEIFRPQAEASQAYTHLYEEAYRPIYPALRESLHHLSDLSTRPPASITS
jgi:sugar (pentulose or hexulose) kinase